MQTETTTTDDKQKAKPLHFTKVYDKGWNTISSIIKENALAAKVYVFLVQHCDIHNAVVCSVELLAAEMECSTRSIMRATKWLEENRYLVIAKIATANAYILRPDDVWKTSEDHKQFWSFGAAALVSKAHNKTLKRRMTVMIEGKEAQQPELFDVIDGETGEILPRN